MILKYMLLLNKATSPENTVYFISATIFGFLKNNSLSYSELYEEICTNVFKKKINFTTYLLSLDFLFLLDKIYLDKEGVLHVSSWAKNN